MYLSTKQRDSCFLMEDDTFAFVQERGGRGTVLCDVIKQGNTAEFFDMPSLSKLLNIVYIRDGRVFKKKK